MVAKLTWDRGNGKRFRMPQRPTHGMNTRKVVEIGEKLGCSVTVKRGTGEKVICHAAFKFKPVTFDAHSRLDAPRSLSGFVQKVWDRVDEMVKTAVAAAK